MKSEIITIDDERYPKFLRGIQDAPKKLYYKGEWREELFENCLAVVGTRRMTTYGKRAAEQLVGELATAGLTIVSGFMYGIDAKAHETALKVGGKTIAVLPCGIDLVHPDFQKSLYDEIIKSGGLIISEWEKDFQPALWTFPKRNRIVAGLSKSTLVIEAPGKSGSLITADFAKKYKRKLFVVPGPILSETWQGSLNLLKEGAQLITEAKEILNFYGLDRLELKTKDEKEDSGNQTEQKIVRELKKEPLDLNEISRILEINSSKAASLLSFMELKGIILEEGGKYYYVS